MQMHTLHYMQHCKREISKYAMLTPDDVPTSATQLVVLLGGTSLQLPGVEGVSSAAGVSASGAGAGFTKIMAGVGPLTLVGTKPMAGPQRPQVIWQ